MKVGIKLAQRAILRASTGLYFLEDCLRNRSGGTDGAYSRSWYLLLSYNFELILNALICYESKKDSVDEIIDEIRKTKPSSHDYEKLSKKISENLLKQVGITSVKKISNNFTEYIVSLENDNKIVIQDLIDVRYDFKKDSLRDYDSTEVSRIKKELKDLRKIINNIKEKVFKKE